MDILKNIYQHRNQMKILVITFIPWLESGKLLCQAYGVRTGLLKIFPNAEINYLSFPDFKLGQGEAWKERFYWARSASKGICGLPLVEIQKTGATSIFPIRLR